MALISFLPLNKKTIILLVFISFSIITGIISLFYEIILPFTIDLFEYSSQTLVGLPFLVQHLFFRNEKYKIFSHFSKKDYFIFILMMILTLLQSTIYAAYDDTLFFAGNTFNRFNIDIIILEILSKFTSNSRFFIHHVIGQIIFYIPSLMIDIYIIHNDDENLNFNFKHFLIMFLDTLIDDILLTYKKYLMEIKFIPPFIVSFIFGSVSLTYILILFSFTIINRNIICFDKKCFDIFDYDTDSFENTFSLFIIMSISLIINCIFFFFYYHIFDLFTTSHTIFIFCVYEMMSSIKTAKDNNLSLGGWLLLSLAFIFIFIGIFIYLEIIELNFCNLNENTRITISERARETTEGIMPEEFLEIELPKKDEEESEEKKEEKRIEIAPGYFIYI